MCHFIASKSYFSLSYYNITFYCILTVVSKCPRKTQYKKLLFYVWSVYFFVEKWNLHFCWCILVLYALFIGYKLRDLGESMILVPKWPKFHRPWISSPKLTFSEMERSIVLIEIEHHMVLHKQTTIESHSLCIYEGLWIVVLLSMVVFRSWYAIFQKRLISTISWESTWIFTACLWYNKAEKSQFSRFPFIPHTISFLLICCLCS